MQYVAIVVFAGALVLALRSGPDPVIEPPAPLEQTIDAEVAADAGFDDDFFGAAQQSSSLLSDEQLLVALDAVSAATGRALSEIGEPLDVVVDAEASRARFVVAGVDVWVIVSESEGRWVARVDR